MLISSRIEIENFNDKNFELWNLKMEDLVVDKEQWIVVDTGTQNTCMKPTGMQPTGMQPTGTQPTNTQLTGT
jgi:hypothetical protein